jgi:hypothetical protein
MVLPHDDCPAQFQRNPTRAALVRLTQLLQLRPDPFMQDWDLELADSSRLSEFLDCYEDGDLDDDSRFLLMAMIIASLDDVADEVSELGSHWPRAELFLRRDGALHASTLSSWACGNESDPDHQFALTPRIRPVWRAVLRALSE